MPVVTWAPFMRVDMLAVALSLFGLVAAFKALERPRLIYLAALLFVAAVYTKQTSIAAPAATFARADRSAAEARDTGDRRLPCARACGPA